MTYEDHEVALPTWFWQQRLDSLIEQDEADIRQRAELVKWIEQIDAKREAAATEMAKCQEAIQ